MTTRSRRTSSGSTITSHGAPPCLASMMNRPAGISVRWPIACSNIRRRSTSLNARSSIRLRRCALNSSSHDHQVGHSPVPKMSPISTRSSCFHVGLDVVWGARANCRVNSRQPQLRLGWSVHSWPILAAAGDARNSCGREGIRGLECGVPGNGAGVLDRISALLRERRSVALCRCELTPEANEWPFPCGRDSTIDGSSESSSSKRDSSRRTPRRRRPWSGAGSPTDSLRFSNRTAAPGTGPSESARTRRRESPGAVSSSAPARRRGHPESMSSTRAPAATSS